MLGTTNIKRERSKKILPMLNPDTEAKHEFNAIVEVSQMKISAFGDNIDRISQEFSKFLPTETTKFIGYTISDFFVISEIDILFLLYKNASYLTYYKSECSEKTLEIHVSEDYLHTLKVDMLRKLAIVGCGLFEKVIYVYRLDNLQKIAVLNSINQVYGIEICLHYWFLISINTEKDVYK